AAGGGSSGGSGGGLGGVGPGFSAGGSGRANASCTGPRPSTSTGSGSFGSPLVSATAGRPGRRQTTPSSPPHRPVHRRYFMAVTFVNESESLRGGTLHLLKDEPRFL